MNIYHILQTDSTLLFSMRNCSPGAASVLCLCTFFTLLRTQHDIHLRTLNYLFLFMILTKLCCDWLTMHRSCVDHKKERQGLGKAECHGHDTIMPGSAELKFYFCHSSAPCSVSLLNFSLLIGKIGMINPTFQSCPNGCRWYLHSTCRQHQPSHGFP